MRNYPWAALYYADLAAATSPDAMRLDASRAEADAELAEWRALERRRRG